MTEDTLSRVVQPTFCSVDREVIRRMVLVCESAIENAAECLARHEAAFGRTSRSGLRLAQMYEKDIAAARLSLCESRKILGWPALRGEDKENGDGA